MIVMNDKQLYEKRSKDYSKIYPLTYMRNILDENGNNNLVDIFKCYNHIYVTYANNVSSTRLLVPEFLRKYGLWISYEKDGKLYTEAFLGSNIDAKDEYKWIADSNWEYVPDLQYIESASSRIPKQAILPEHLSNSILEMISNAGAKITNLVDEEDLTEADCHVIKLKDRKYNKALASGLGYKILRKNWVNGKNILTQDMINEPNTIYEVRYDYDLNEETINIPEGCTLNFNGGSIYGGYINGIINNSYVNVENFGAKGDGINDDGLAIRNASSVCSHIIFGKNKTYKISKLYQSPQNSYYGNFIGLAFINHSIIIDGNDSILIFSNNVFNTDNKYIRIFNVGPWEQNFSDNIVDTCKINNLTINFENINQTNYRSIHCFQLHSRHIVFSNFNYENIDNIVMVCPIVVGTCNNFTIKNSTIVNNLTNESSGGAIWVMLTRTNYSMFTMENCYIECDTNDEDITVSSLVQKNANTDFIEVELDIKNCIFKSANKNKGTAYFMSNDIRTNPNFKTIAHFTNCQFYNTGEIYKPIIFAQSRKGYNYKFNFVLDNCYIKENPEYKDILEDDASDYSTFTGTDEVEFEITCNNCIIDTNNYILRSRNGNRYGNLIFNNCNINCAGLLSAVSNISKSRFNFIINNSIININNVPFLTTDNEYIYNSIINFSSDKVYTIIGKTSDNSYISKKEYNNVTINGRPVNYNNNYYIIKQKAIEYNQVPLYILGIIDENDIGGMFILGPDSDVNKYVFDGTKLITTTSYFSSNYKDIVVYNNSMQQIIKSNINIGTTFLNKKNIGDTTTRPTDVSIGFQYFDTTLNKPIWWTGTKWIDSAGSDV